ncbi:membrane protein [Jannaschia pagri]|uniref:Membrane protein n=1 Tax=Jannaschia pagri TaxID=2829797 RepID=A0ABQ4NNI5_9RHOB|nr:MULTISPECIES: DUF6691 family protein [unclassified Jannaschia]GIT91986.1 membrane protein [Jannaschia sp. AI_61]GIT95820.1 membrane protein [Jannaschia sp. AI_62]
MRLISAACIGLIFGFGIALSGMANPAKVLNFFDLFGTWDPSLAFVMGGALLVAVPGYRFVFRRSAPLQEHAFHVPQTRQIDARLLAGAGLFGAGWGLAGFCPGGALPALGTGQVEVFLFVGAASVGILIVRLWPRATPKQQAST